jgi:isopenicillin N synthase-like dioxygenase
MHRVVTPPDEQVAGSRRQSLAFFYNPAPDALIAPITRGDEPAVREPIRYDELQQQKTRLTHAT